MWDVFGSHLDKVPSEEIFKLSDAEIEAFSCMKHHSFQTSLAMVTKSSMPSAEIMKQHSEWHLIENINKAAKACNDIKQLAEIDCLRQDVNSF